MVGQVLGEIGSARIKPHVQDDFFPARLIGAQSDYTRGVMTDKTFCLGDFLAFRRIVASDQAQQISLETTTASASTLPEGLKADDLVAAGGAALQNQNYQAAIESYKRAL